jgi:hypothetical protein
MVFYTHLGEMRAECALRPYLHLIEKAWDSLDMKRGGGVLCAEGLPTLYLITRKQRVTPKQAQDLHRKFWNQGLAKILVIADPINVRIFSGMKKPERESNSDTSGLVEAIQLADYSLNMQSFYRQLATGAYYRKHNKDFNPLSTIDNSLLENLRSIRDMLISDDQGLPVKTAHTLLARILFICYLCDRKIIDLGNYNFCQCDSGTKLVDMLNELPTTGDQQSALHSLFNQLKNDFNGNMFEHSPLTECQKLTKPHMQSLIAFLKADDVKSGQTSFDFWAYDFQWIPVETISAIYEEFLKGEDSKGKKETGAFYTPRFLAESTINTLVREDCDLSEKRFLDPACGSGIFLVILFNRLAADWMAAHPDSKYSQRSNALQAILKNQLYGIDVNQTACRIACFSLYLAYLDRFNPPDIKQHIERKGRLPNILQYRNTDNLELNFPVIQEEDFLEPSNPLPNQFDFIVGNPPWSGRSAVGLHHRFAEKVPEHLAENGKSCLLLPSKMFLNDKTNRFQERWFQNIRLEEVIQLADYRKILFKEAKCPCMMVLFRKGTPDIQTATFEYITPKVSHIDYRDGVIPVAPHDRKEISLNQLLIAAKKNAAPILWKQNLWATPRDIKFLDLLNEIPKLHELSGPARENKRWIKGQGFQPECAGTEKPIPRPWDSDALYIEAGKMFPNLILLQQQSERLGDRFPILHRVRDKRIYEAPMVLITQGVSGIDGIPKVAFCDFDLLFQDSLQSISGSKKDEDLLLFLTCYLRSKLAKYFLFHTSANWGTEQDKVHLTELLRIPFPLPESEYAHPDAKKIIKQVVEKLRSLKRELKKGISTSDLFDSDDSRKQHKEELVWIKQRTNATQAEVEPLIYKYFDLIDQEIVLIEDTVDVVLPSITPNNALEQIRTLEPVHKNTVPSYRNGISIYAQTLCNTLNTWASDMDSPTRVSAIGGVNQVDETAYITLSLDKIEQLFEEIPLAENTSKAICALAQSSAERHGRLEYMKGSIVFEESNSLVHIFKPTALLGWTRTAAINDASEIYARIARARNNGGAD